MNDAAIKQFILDTNVPLHNPNALFMFAENEVIIPFDVIEELDKFKTATDDLGRDARTSTAKSSSSRSRTSAAEAFQTNT